MSDAATAAALKSAARPKGNTRWIVCGLLFFAVVLSYVDRLVLSILKPELAAQYGWSEVGYADITFWFQAVYGVCYVFAGRIVDRVGSRIGYAAAVALWTLGHVGHALFTSTTGMILARIPLAAGEAATFPAALKATAEWFPRRERALAIGLFNAGSNVGAVVTPLLVPFLVVTLDLGWRAAFVVTGALSLVWLTAWLAFYRRPAEHRRLDPDERAWIAADADPPAARPAGWGRILRIRQTWAYVLGRFLIDPVWWTLLFWLPGFFAAKYHLSLSEFGPPLVVVYLLADAGSIAGGWLSSRLLALGWSVNAARKTAMLAAALCAVPIAFATGAQDMWTAVLLIGLACAGHQAFSANLYAQPSDLFPSWTIGSVIGLGGLSGAVGGMLMSKYAGAILDTVGSYQPIFVFASAAYLLALLVVHLVVPRYEVVRSAQLGDGASA